MSSVGEQLDDRFEIVLVDDGSSDDSVSIMHDLAARYPIIRVVSLKRDRARKLGETWNCGIRNAWGQYCLLHIDCDDIWEPHLAAWVEVFHQVETAMGVDILIAGQQVKMAKRSFLLRHGPYPNIFRAQDLKMHRKFAALGRLWFLHHEVFRTRLLHPRGVKLRRSIVHTIDIMITDFRFGARFGDCVRWELDRFGERSLKLALLRLTMLPIVWVLAKFKPPIQYAPMIAEEEYSEYKQTHRGTFPDLMRRHNSVPDWSRLPASSRPIFDR